VWNLMVSKNFKYSFIYHTLQALEVQLQLNKKIGRLNF
jgi:hypothetical protein